MRVDFTDPFRDLAIGPRTYIVLVTRAHRYDFDCLKQLVERDLEPRYIGMIGQPQAGARRVPRIARGGHPAGASSRACARPWAIDIGAETPRRSRSASPQSSIAVRRGGTALDASLAARENVLERLLPEAARGDTHTEPAMEETDG